MVFIPLFLISLSSLPDIVIATPKKFLNYIKDNTVANLKETLESLVIDEADLILSFGYDEDVREICGYLPKIYQSYLMSATLNAVHIYHFFIFNFSG